MDSFLAQFQAYFSKSVAEKAASSLKPSAEIELKIGDESLTFKRAERKNEISQGSPKDPDIIFALTPGAARAILEFPSEEIGPIGVHIARLVVSQQPDLKVSLQIKSGFLTLWNRGYFGILTAGGVELAGFLASRGLSGIDALRSALKKMRN